MEEQDRLSSMSSNLGISLDTLLFLWKNILGMARANNSLELSRDEFNSTMAELQHLML